MNSFTLILILVFINSSLLLMPVADAEPPGIVDSASFSATKAKQAFVQMEDSLETMAKNLEVNLAAGRISIPVYNVVKDFNFDKTGATLITQKLQHVIDSCTAKGPVRLFFPRGVYLTGTIILKSGVHIELDAGAKIVASNNPHDYPVLYPEYKANTDLQVNKSLFYAEKADGISLTGKGTIDFRGDDPVYFNTGNNDTRRPFGLRIISSKNIYIEGLMFINSAQWMQHYLNCENLMIENLTVYNHAHQNNDGLDIDGCRNVYVRKNRIDSDDDGLCLKSNGPAKCEDVLIEDCVVSSHCNGLKLGTESTGGFKNIIYRNCKVVPSVTGYHYINGTETDRTAITLIITDGGSMENVWFDHIDAQDCVTPIFITLGNRSRKYNKDAPKPGIGSVKNIMISNFSSTGAGPMSSSITGLSNTNKLQGVILENISVELTHPGIAQDSKTDMDKVLQKVKPGYPSPEGWGDLPSAGFYFRYIEGLQLKNIHIKSVMPEPRTPVIVNDCSGVAAYQIDYNKRNYKIIQAPE